MDHVGTFVGRRSFLAAGCVSAVSMAAGAEGASPPASIPPASMPAASTPAETANARLVADFCKAWGDDPPDADKIASQYLAEDCTIRFGDTMQPVTGQTAAVKLFNSFFTNGQRYELRIVDMLARGPVVMNSRIDTTIRGKRVTNPTEVVGVFVIRDGKIKEWSDYV
jgi:limonene-1,2-epoxide hydrolase